MVKSKDIKLLAKIMMGMLVLSSLVGIFSSYYAANILEFVYGKEFSESARVLVILIIGLIFGIQSALIGYPLLGAFGKNSLANSSIISAGVVQVSMLIILFTFDKVNSINVAACVVISEFVLFIVRAKFGYDLVREITEKDKK